jgi:hypothetical protein
MKLPTSHIASTRGAGDRIRRLRAAVTVAATGAVFLAVSSVPAAAQAQKTSPAESSKQKAVSMATHATGDFTVKLSPDGAVDKAEGASLGRMTSEKQFHGDLEATSKGTMLTAMTDVKGSAGYVAIERVTGTLRGRSGSFVLQHNGTMSAAGQMLSIVVVPDSGTGQLVGLAGKLTIIIAADGKHSYDFEYTLPEAH